MNRPTGSLTGFEPALTSATNLRLSLSATNSIKKLLQMDSNHHLQNRNLVCYHYTMEQYIVAPEGVEPSLTEPKPVVLPLYHRALSVEPRGVEPRSEDFQSSAYTKSAKVPYVVAPDGFEPPLPDSESDVLTVTP